MRQFIHVKPLQHLEADKTDHNANRYSGASYQFHNPVSASMIS
jgi:hypothetical protein